MLTATDIHNKDFKRGFRGYNMDEVDEFLDLIINDYEKLCRENSKLKEDLSRSEKDVERMAALEKNLQETLLVAQRTAAEVTRAAQQKANDLKEAAEKECQNMRERTELETSRQIATATAKVRNIVDEYDRLVREKNKFFSMVRATLATELAAVDGAISRMPHPEEEEVAPPVATVEINTDDNNEETTEAIKADETGETV